MRIISEEEFRERIAKVLSEQNTDCQVGSVTGPGRSGAVAAVYASHILRIPFIPYGSLAPAHLGRVLIIDTAMESGATLRKAERRYAYADPLVVACYHEPPRVAFWYEATKPQRFRNQWAERAHEPMALAS